MNFKLIFSTLTLAFSLANAANAEVTEENIPCKRLTLNDTEVEFAPFVSLRVQYEHSVHDAKYFLIYNFLLAPTKVTVLTPAPDQTIEDSITLIGERNEKVVMGLYSFKGTVEMPKNIYGGATTACGHRINFEASDEN